MRFRAGLALARAPRLSAWLLRRRRTVNLEKLCFLALVRRGDVVVEAGANEGYYTALFSRLVGRRGRVHAFEPVAATHRRLAANLARWGRHANVVLNRAALVDAVPEGGEVLVHVPAGDPAQASLARHAAGSWEGAPEVRSEPCPALTLDGYLDGRGEAAGDGAAGAPNFFKCDAEGAELCILRGAAGTLRRRPPLLHLEINPQWSRDLGWEPPDLVRHLLPLGYSEFVLVGDRRARRLADPAGELAAFAGSANLVCAVPALHGARMGRLRAALAERYDHSAGGEHPERPEHPPGAATGGRA